MFKLDLNKFKKISSDDKSTTLQHDHGHCLKIAHAALTPKLRAQLHELPMAEGGKVKLPPPPDKAKVEPAKPKVHPVPGSKYPTSEEARKKAPKFDSVDEEAEREKKMAAGGEVATSGNPKLQQAYMYAEGDEVQDPTQMPVQNASPVQAPVAPQAPVIVNVNGGQPAPQQPPAPAEVYNQTYEQQKANNPGQPDQFSRHAAMSAGQGAKESNESQAQRAQMQMQSQQADAAKENAQRAQLGLAPLPGSAPQQAPGAEHGAGLTPSQAPQGAQGSNPMDDYAGAVTKGLGEMEAGIRQGAAAQGKLGEMQAQQLGSQVQLQQQLAQNYQQHYNELDAERQAFQKDIQNQHIDPQHYMHDMGTGKKISTALGMIIAGAGAGILGQENPVMKYINQQIERDVDAQKANLNNKQSLLNANMRQFGNLHDATLMTNVMQRDIVANQLQQNIAKMQNPMAKAQALQQLGELHQKNAMFMNQLAASRALANVGGQGAQGGEAAVSQALNMMRMTNPERAKEIEARYVPGVGMADIPVKDDVREQMRAHQKLDDSARDLQAFVKTHHTWLNNPLDPDYNVGAQKAQNLQQLIRHGQLQTVYREGEQPLLDKMVNGNPAGFAAAFQTQPKLKELIHENDRQFKILKDSHRIRPFSGQASSSGNGDAASGIKFTPKGK